MAFAGNSRGEARKAKERFGWGRKEAKVTAEEGGFGECIRKWIEAGMGER